MTPPVQPESGAERADKIRHNIAAYKSAIAAGTHTQADLDEYLKSEQDTPEQEMHRTAADKVGSAAQAFSDASTFGLSGLATDALSGGDFAENRRIRKEGKAALPAGVRIGAEVLGSLATPIPGGTLLKTAPKAGLLAKIGRGAGDAALQSGVAGTVSGLDKATPEGLVNALGKGAGSAVAGGIAGGALSAIRPTLSALRTGGRIIKAKPLDEATFALNDAMKAADNALYGVANAQGAAIRSTPEIQAVLKSQTVKPFADIVRKSESFGKSDDATVLAETYKLMSEAQRKLIGVTEGTAEHLAGNAMKRGDITLGKGRMIAAANTSGITGLAPAIAGHAKAAGEQDALTNVSDAAARIMGGKSNKGDKILLDSPEALRREIKGMTPPEAEAGLKGMLGRGREAIHMTTNPLTGLGIVPSAVRTLRTPFQFAPFVRQLDEQAGRTSGTLLDRIAEAVRGTTARTIGAEAGQVP